MQKIDARKLSRTELMEKRRYVIELHEENVPVMQIVKISGLSWPAVNTAIKRYKTTDIENLEPERRGRKKGTGRFLSDEQEIELRNTLYQKRPWQVRLKTQHSESPRLWNRDAVRQLIWQQYELSLSESAVAKYLYRWGFPPMKQNQLPIKRCTRKIQYWLKDTYEPLIQRIENEHAEIFWLSRKRLIIDDTKHSDWPKRLAMISAINRRGKEHWIIIKGYFTEEKQVLFLKTLLRHTKRPIFLIRNNHDLFKGRDVLSFVNQSGSKIEIFPEHPL